MIIDSHHHLWKIDRGVYNWISDEIAGIRKDFTPRDLAPHLKACGVHKTILVQASETASENAFLLEQTKEGAFIGGIVAWVDLTRPDIREVLQELAEIDIIKGIRPVLQGIEDTNWILRPDVLEALRFATRAGLRFDALITPRHLETIDTLATRLPDLPMVIDHAAKPVINLGNPFQSEWAVGMKRLARHPHIHAKISGLATEFGAGWNAVNLKPTFDSLYESFGAHRLMWGSDWPVLELDGTYEEWFSCVTQLIATLPAQEQSDILGGSAARFYGIRD